MISTDSPSCAADTFCARVFDVTHQVWLAESSHWLVIKPLRIVGIIVGALLLRWLFSRVIRKATSGTVPAILRPLKEKTPAALLEVGLLTERRRQRAETIGSLLRSAAGAMIFGVAGMMILAEFGLNLGPVLASVSIAGVALGFGAQSLVKDILSGVFMLLEDQYGVGDSVDLGEAAGTVEAVGLRVTTVRDVRGVVWYVRNGEVVRVGNKSQGWATVVLDIPVGHSGVSQATEVLRAAVTDYAADPANAAEFLEPPEVLGVEQLTIEGAVLRVIAKTSSEAQWEIARELRGQLTAALDAAGISSQIMSNRPIPRRDPNGK